jgi:hypothetical protein
VKAEKLQGTELLLCVSWKAADKPIREAHDLTELLKEFLWPLCGAWSAEARMEEGNQREGSCRSAGES